MEYRYKIILLIATSSSSFTIFLIIALFCIYKRTWCSKDDDKSWDKESNSLEEVKEMETKGELVKFEGGEELTCYDVLDAPGEVIGKSSYGTLYKANLVRSDSVVVLRFLRPACSSMSKVQDVMHVVQVLGSIRHPNLVPLCGFYVGPRGEKLLVHPFYRRGNLAQFIREGNGESQEWNVIYMISVGVVRGLYHLHTSLQEPIIHGNLKSKNILLGRNQQPFVSDFGLHMLLNPSTFQEMIQDAAADGYKPPELIKTNDTTLETDIFNLGVILLELVTGREPNTNDKPSPYREFTSNATLDHRILKLSRLAIACCSPLPSFRPDIKYICKKLQEIGS